MRILLVDDDVMLGKLYKYWLEKEGHEVVLAHDPSEVPELLNNQPDVLVSDIDMPLTNGIDLAQKLRAQMPELPVYFCTGSYPAHEVVREARKLGPVFDKEGRPVQLLAALRKLSTTRSKVRKSARRARIQFASGTGSVKSLAVEATESPPAEKRKEHRRDVRTNVVMGVRLRFSNANEAVAAKSVNISQQGLQLKSCRKPAVGSEIRAAVDIAGENIRLVGRVVRAKEGPPGQFRISVELRDVPKPWRDFAQRVRHAREARLRSILNHDRRKD